MTDFLNRWWWGFNTACAVFLGIHFAFAGSLLSLCLAIVNAAVAVWSLTLRFKFDKLKKESTNGEHRGTEEDPRDPGDEAGSGVTHHYTLAPGITYSISASTGVTLKNGLPTAIKKDEPVEEIERVQSDLPILAHRIAGLVFDGTSRPFRSLNQGLSFGIDADASCSLLSWHGQLIYTWPSAHSTSTSTKPHTAPDLGCDCGFYALPSDVEPWGDGSNYVTLMVELSGRVIEHERGYRAQHQRVVECQFSACPLCGRRAEVVAVDDNGAFVGATCRPHAWPNNRLIEAADLQRVLKVPVTFLGAPSLSGDTTDTEDGK